MRKFLALAAAILLPLAGIADKDKAYKQFGDTRVYYSAFNSNFIHPEIASAYNISRGVDKGLVNIAVVDENAGGGRTAVVEGTATNILAQQQNLEFFEVREGEAVYYLAPFKFENEDPMTFKIQVKVGDSRTPYSVNFQRTFYHDK